MKALCLLMSLGCLLIPTMAGSLSTGTTEIPLPSAVGEYYVDAPREIPFDAGTSFDSIAAVSIIWSGMIVAGLGHGDGLWRPESEWFSWPGSFSAVIRPDPGAGGYWRAGTGLLEGEFDAISMFEGLFSPSWDFLLDGVAKVEISVNPAIVLGGVMVTPPWAILSEAKLVIDYPTSVEPRTWGRIKSMFR